MITFFKNVGTGLLIDIVTWKSKFPAYHLGQSIVRIRFRLVKLLSCFRPKDANKHDQPILLKLPSNRGKGITLTLWENSLKLHFPNKKCHKAPILVKLYKHV